MCKAHEKAAPSPENREWSRLERGNIKTAESLGNIGADEYFPSQLLINGEFGISHMKNIRGESTIEAYVVARQNTKRHELLHLLGIAGRQIGYFTFLTDFHFGQRNHPDLRRVTGSPATFTGRNGPAMRTGCRVVQQGADTGIDTLIE